MSISHEEKLILSLPELPPVYKKLRVWRKHRDFREAVEVVEVPLPKLKVDEILVEVKYAGIEATDVNLIQGKYGPLAEIEEEVISKVSQPTPDVQKEDMGLEGVGVVVEKGSQVKDLEIGQAVCFFGHGFGFREFLPVKYPVNSDKSTEALIFPIPKLLPEYVAFPCTGLTAIGSLAVLCGDSHMENKDKVMVVTAACGGLGHLVVQLAKKWCKCGTVVGICGTEEKAKILKEQLGVDMVINYSKEDVNQVLKKSFPEGIDLLYDGVGGKTRKKLLQLVKPFGRVMAVGSVAEYLTDEKSSPLEWWQLVLSSLTVSGFAIFWIKSHPRFEELAKTLFDLFEKGEIKVLLDKRCNEFVGMDGITKAEELLHSGKNIGKVYAKILV